ncbi:meiotic cell cortex C-terminal pleckstrin homology-domain-containing protein [Aspergillus egyptiacus]|nr:meiotic cell cortex C-terminal pleckstrin homology-domain-containing protein [Aspergillus egyptiacus]
MEATFQTPVAASAFPTPSTTPKRRPAMHSRADSSSGSTSSPASLPNNNYSPGDPSDLEDVEGHDSLSPLDPRRFTPNLHASLVSEILALRREVESKTKSIDILERTLDESRIENEELTERLSRSSKDSRLLKHQLQLLEGGSSSALGELAKERDDALEGLTELRRKFEQAQKKAKNRENELERTTALWTRDKEAWDEERRNLERKVHVVEGRLKVVLNEVAAQAASREPSPHSDGGGAAKDASTGRDSDSGSIYSSSQGRRRTSITSMSSDDADEDRFRNMRYSVMSTAHMLGSRTNLAQELAFDEDEFSLDDDMTPQSPEELPEERPASVHSQLSNPMGMDTKARKILGLSFNSSLDGYPTRMEEAAEFRDSIPIPAPSFRYKDTGVQYSPPLSPILSLEKHAEDENDTKPSFYTTTDSSTSTMTIDMVSSSCQTVESLPTPPWTPRVEASPEVPVAEQTAMVSSSVQTEPPAESEKAKPVEDDDNGANIEVPMIAIHPPQSEPSSPRGSVVLPPQTKSVSCQVDFNAPRDSRTVGIQTEPIRIDQRPVKLPASLLPSAIPDLPLSSATQDHLIQPYRPPSPRTTKGDRKPPPLVVETPTEARRKLGHHQAYPGNNDNGPLSANSKASLRRPLRSSSLFAGFEQTSDEESPENTRDIFTDDELLNRPFASYKLRRGKLVSSHERRRSLDEATLPDVDEDLGSEAGSGLGSLPESAWSRSGSRQQDMRRAAMISSGAATHQRRARSPSEPSINSGSGSNNTSVAPPFPVPIRLSSRKFPQSGSDGRQSPTPSRNFSDRPPPGIVRRPTLRRVRSAATISQADSDRPPTRSSPAMSISSCAPDSPRRPPVPFDDITMPRNRRSALADCQITQPQHLTHERHDSTGASVQPTSVVDAIAQTMVGEWMWKYIRRRRSFGGDKDNWDGRNAEEVSANITNSGVRHKRWVWLAPYERAVMWSSKQPTSGPALLGKSGRKLIIQSVLDVKDDNPLPKGSSAQFNRSILILTPQRALKFTATSVERHYVWLTALSFLSHSAIGAHELASLPPVPQEEYSRQTPTASLRRNPIRDSIRIAKSRPRGFPKGKKRDFTNNYPEPVPEIPGLEADSRDSEDAADPPTVPRFSNHSRKRSHTAPRMPIPNIRSFSSQNTVPSMRSSPDPVAPSYSQGFSSERSSFSPRTSEGSVRTGNFFDAIGTVRMEAFIDQTDTNRYRMSARQHMNKVSTPWSVSKGFPVMDFPYEQDELFRNDDPFRGF